MKFADATSSGKTTLSNVRAERAPTSASTAPFMRAIEASHDEAICVGLSDQSTASTDAAGCAGAARGSVMRSAAPGNPAAARAPAAAITHTPAITATRRARTTSELHSQ